ncbi:hypothetical protein [Symmachiella macrocystis]|uniref:hypothetical protein n=1 Tax=Symmachiella macrocystis TaxID=2527985 RepID=UPI0011B5A900|nr:hypothetical protein [Symmachiella macrocystis]
MADNSAAIAEILGILRSGQKKITVDGMTVEHDFAELRRQLRALMAADDFQGGRRPAAVRIKIPGV